MRRYLEFAAAAVLACVLATPAFAQSQTSAPAGGGSTTSTPAPMPPEDAVPDVTGSGVIWYERNPGRRPPFDPNIADDDTFVWPAVDLTQR